MLSETSLDAKTFAISIFLRILKELTFADPVVPFFRRCTSRPLNTATQKASGPARLAISAEFPFHITLERWRLPSKNSQPAMISGDNKLFLTSGYLVGGRYLGLLLAITSSLSVSTTLNRHQICKAEIPRRFVAVAIGFTTQSWCVRAFPSPSRNGMHVHRLAFTFRDCCSFLVQSLHEVWLQSCWVKMLNLSTKMYGKCRVDKCKLHQDSKCSAWLCHVSSILMYTVYSSLSIYIIITSK